MIRLIQWPKGPSVHVNSLVCLLFTCLAFKSQGQSYLPVSHYDTTSVYSRAFAIANGQIYYGNSRGLKRTASKETKAVSVLEGRIEQLTVHPNGPMFCSSRDTVFVFSKDDLRRKHHGAHFELPMCKDQYGDSIRNHVEKVAPVPESYNLVWVLGKQGIHLYERVNRNFWKIRRSFQNDPSQFELAFPFLGNKVNDFYVEHADRLWLGTDAGLYLLDGIKTVSEPIIADVNITAVSDPIKLDHFKTRIWVAGTKGFSEQKIWAIDYEPRDSKLRIRPSHIRSLSIGDQARGFVFDIIATQRGDVWLGMEDVVRFKDIGKATDWEFFESETHQLFYDNFDGLDAQNAVLLQEDQEGQVWVGTPNGVYVIKPGVAMDLVDQTLVSCNGEKDGRLVIRAVDGEPPYQFLLDSINVSGIRKIQQDSATLVFENLPAGTYKIQATDRLRKDTGQINITLLNPPPLTAKMVKYRRPSYTGRRDGVVRVEAIEGGRVSAGVDFFSGKSYSGYVYKWSNEADTTHNPVNSHLPLGPFSVNVMDTVGCTLTVRDTFLHALQLHELWSKSLDRSSVIRLSQLVFETDAYEIQQNHIPSLEEVSMFLDQRPDVVLEIGGHSNVVEDPASQAYLMKLSLQRAEAVRQYLLAGGIPPYQVKAKGYGGEQPLFEKGNKDNQRVEITILKIKE